MVSYDYDDLLESFMNNSSKAYEPYFNNNQEEESDNMSLKTVGTTVRRKIAVFFEVLAAIAAVFTIIGFIINYNIDFALTTKTEGNYTEYIFSKSGMDIKNANATLYYVAEFPVNESKDSIDYLYESVTSNYDSSNCTFRYEFPVNHNETIFCEALSYMYYDTANPYNIPKISTYIKVEYEISLIPNIPLSKWYRVSYEKDTRYLYPHNRKTIKRIVDSYDENQYLNLLDFYNKNKGDLGYASSNNEEITFVTNEKSIDDMIEWINANRVKPLTKIEEDELTEMYKYHANLQEYENDKND